MALPPQFRVHTVAVEPQIGEGGIGDTYGAKRWVVGFLEFSRILVRARDGAEVVSEARFFTEVSESANFPPDSRVTLPDGSVGYVLAASPRDDGGITGLAHLEVALR